MATIFNQMFCPDEGKARVPVHAMYGLLERAIDGDLSAATFKTLMDGSESSDDDIDLLYTTLAAMTPADRYIWALRWHANTVLTDLSAKYPEKAACITCDADFKTAMNAVSVFDRSCVNAGSNTAQAMTSGSATTIVFEVENTDLLGEYDHATGIFTAKKAGIYSASWQTRSASAAWALGKVWRTYLSKNNSDSGANVVWSGARDAAEVAITRTMYSSGVALSVPLAKDDTLRVKTIHDQGGNINTADDQNFMFFHINRVS
jgi:hypothetical protein